MISQTWINDLKNSPLHIVISYFLALPSQSGYQLAREKLSILFMRICGLSNSWTGKIYPVFILSEFLKDKYKSLRWQEFS
jgi:hypothetical protein